MTTGETEQTSICGGQTAGGRTAARREGRTKMPVTTLSTIAVQAGQSQIVISVLKSGSAVHLQLVQVHPGFCEIGSDRDENRTLIQEQQQLVEKLKKHESEVLAVVEKRRQAEQRRRRTRMDEGMTEQRRNKTKEEEQEEEEEVHEAMAASLKEGWTLLLRLLERRQEVLTLASDFYCRAQEFAVGIDRVEDLQVRPDNDGLTEAQLTYDCMRRDLLGKSLQVLTCSGVLLQKLRRLQKTEALQRRGGVLKDEDEEDESSQCSRGMVLRLEKLVEMLQDRRRRADQAVRLQLQRVENGIMVQENNPESRQAGSDDWSLSVDLILDQDLESGSTSTESINLKSDSQPKETSNLQTGSRSEEARDLQSGSRSDLQSGSKPEESRNLQSGFNLDLKVESRSDLELDSKSEETRDVQLASKIDQTPGSRLDMQLASTLNVKYESGSEQTKDVVPVSRSEDSRLDLHSGSRQDLQPESRSEFKPVSRPEIRNLQSGFKLNFKAGSRSDIKVDSKSEETRYLQPGSRLDQKPGSSIEMQPASESRPAQTRDVVSGPRTEETKNPESGFKLDLKLESGPDLKFRSHVEETRDLQRESRSDLRPEFRLEFKPVSRPEIRNLQSGFKFNFKAGSRSDFNLDCKPEETRDIQSGSSIDAQPACGLDVQPESRSGPSKDITPGSRLEEARKIKPGTRSELKYESRINEYRLDMKPGSTSVETKELQPESGMDLKSRYRSELLSGFRSDVLSQSELDQLQASESEKEALDPGLRSDETKNLKLEIKSVESKGLQPGSKSDMKPGSTPEETTNLQSGLKVNLKAESRSDHESHSSEITRDLQPGSTLDQIPGSTSVHSESRLDLKTQSSLEPTREVSSISRSEKTKDLQSGSKSVLKPESRSDLQPGLRSVQKPVSGSEQTKDRQLGFASEAEDPGLCEPSGKQEVTTQRRAATTTTTTSSRGQEAGPEGAEEDVRQARLTNQRQQLLLSCEHLMEKIWSWLQQSSSVLSSSSEAGQQLSEAEDTMKTHLKLHAQAEAAGQDAENMKQILDQIRALHTNSISRTSSLPPSEPSRKMSPLKALTKQLKRGSADQPGPPAADPTDSLSPELAGKVDLVSKELQNQNQKINSSLQLLRPYVTFLRAAQQVEEEMEDLRQICINRPEEENQEEMEAGYSEISTSTTPRSPEKKKQVDACWQATLQRFLTAQELGNNYVHTVSTVSGVGLNLQSAVTVVQQTIERLTRTKQEVNELVHQQQTQIQKQQEYCGKYRKRLLKTLQDLNGVSELLDSCTLMDLGSDLQTSRLLEHFSQARPHFNQLDAEVEYMDKSWETLVRVQEELEAMGQNKRAVKEDELLELLKLQKRVKTKINQSELILDLSSSFHQTSQQLEALLQSDHVSPSTGSRGSSEDKLSRHREEKQQQIQNLFKTASTLKMDICTAISHSGWTCFRVEQLEARLLSLDSLCVLWSTKAAQHEEKLRRELLTSRLHDDIHQLRDSFKELKKRFSNLKFNYQKRNDRTRNMKAVRNQLQQVELYDEKLQVLRKRLQGVTARLGSEVKDGSVAREVEDAINELQRQMGDFERSVGDHQKTLEMSRRLQQAMEEYQFWCEEASATIARVGKFSSECHNTEAVAALHRQFEKFVWPTVPQQEERISQIAELAVKLHGVEEGQRYVEKTVSRHSEMVESIRELSDGLMELEAKLKRESLIKQQKDEEKEINHEGEVERRRKNETEEKDEEKEKKENRKMKNQQTDNRCPQEAADMYELKETGHTPELTAEHDGKEVPIKRQTAASRKPPLQKSHSQEAESSHRQQLYSERCTSSYCSTHTFSLSCSPVEANRRIHAIHSQLLPVTTEPQAMPPPPVIGPLFSDIQKEFQKKETQEMAQQGVSTSRGTNETPFEYASAGGLLEAELQQQEVMTEDSLSNDEYECPSPDDISLPPLAETPESIMIQSDVEEGFCFSSHSIHVSQYSHQCLAQSEHSGTGNGTVRQQSMSSQTESCPTPSTSFHSNTRFRSESSSFAQSPTIVAASGLITKTGTTNFPQSNDLSLGNHELVFPSGSKPVHKNKTPDIGSNKDDDVPEKRSPSQTEPLLKEHHSQDNQPQRRTGTIGIQGKIPQNVSYKDETLRLAAELNHSPTLPQPFSGPDPEDNAPAVPQTITDTCFSQSLHDSDRCLHQELNPTKTRKEPAPDPKPHKDTLTNTSTRTITQKTINFQSPTSNSQRTLPQVSSSLSSPQELLLSQRETLTQHDPVPQARGFAQDRTQESFKSPTICPQISKTIPHNSNLPQAYPDFRGGLDQDEPSSQISKETFSVSGTQSSSLTASTTVTQKKVYSQSSSADSQHKVLQDTSNPRPQPGNLFSPDSGGPPEVQAPVHSEPNSFSNISKSSSTVTSSNRFSSKQSHHAVYSLHESSTSTCTQQCVHDPGMSLSSPAKPTASLQPDSQTQALAQQSNLHVFPLSPPHLLTPDQDPNICQPMAIREEIRLTPQIQGPSLPAPPTLPQAQAESLPQGKASNTGPPCFTRPLSRATVMEGSPVTLEVEVTGHPEPKLTWFIDGDGSATSPGRALTCEDRKHFLFVPEAPDSDDGLYNAQAALHHHDVGNSCRSSDRWLVAEVFDIISVEWQSWFGTLCFLLWLLYLIVL